MAAAAHVDDEGPAGTAPLAHPQGAWDTLLASAPAAQSAPVADVCLDWRPDVVAPRTWAPAPAMPVLSPWLDNAGDAGFVSPMQGYQPGAFVHIEAPQAAVDAANAPPDETWTARQIDTWVAQQHEEVGKLLARQAKAIEERQQNETDVILNRCRDAVAGIDELVETREECQMPLLGTGTDAQREAVQERRKSFRAQKTGEYEAVRQLELDTLATATERALADARAAAERAQRDVATIAAPFLRTRKATEAREAQAIRTKKRKETAAAWWTGFRARHPRVDALATWTLAEEWDGLRGANRQWCVARWSRVWYVHGRRMTWAAAILAGIVVASVLWGLTEPIGLAPALVDTVRDAHGRVGSTVLARRMCQTLLDPADTLRTEWVKAELRRTAGAPAPDATAGFVPVRLWTGATANVSLDFLEACMRSHAAARAGACLCCAHAGIPLRCMYSQEDDRLMLDAHVTERWPAQPSGKTVRLEDPVFARGAVELPRTDRVSVAYTDVAGAKRRTYAAHAAATCVDWCARL
jgi:hypothetical protein